jgi:hypothetical protein
MVPTPQGTSRLIARLLAQTLLGAERSLPDIGDNQRFKGLAKIDGSIRPIGAPLDPAAVSLSALKLSALKLSALKKVGKPRPRQVEETACDLDQKTLRIDRDSLKSLGNWAS